MYTEKQLQIAKNRNIDLNENTNLNFYELLDIYKDTDEIATIINKHISNDNLIVSIVDKDADGLSAGAVLFHGFKKHLNYVNHKVIISKRKDGNGVNDAVTEQLIEINKSTPIGLILTADMGSSDIVNITKIKDNTVTTISVEKLVVVLENAMNGVAGIVGAEEA